MLHFRTLKLTILFTLFCASLLAAPVFAAVSGADNNAGTLAVSEGDPITDTELRQMLDEFIPTDDAHSTLLIFTQCFGGDMMDNFADRPNTATLSATSSGQCAVYGGYDDDAADALKAGAGRTSDDVHDAGNDGKADSESPQKQGDAVSLEPVDPENGPIRSRHVLVYAGQPDAGEGRDNDQRDKIKENFENDPNTTVHTVGGPAGDDGKGQDGWDHPGSRTGLQEALKEIKALMNEHEQFIMFVTDHGGQSSVDAPSCDGEGCQSGPHSLGESTYELMLEDPFNQPTLNLYAQLPPDVPVMVNVGDQMFFDVFFDIAIDFNGDGFPDTHAAQMPLDEPMLTPLDMFVNIVPQQPSSAPFLVDMVSLDSGAIAKAGALAHGTLATSSGASIYDFQLRQLLDTYIPTRNAHSSLLVFTECYGGDMLDDFAGRPNTAAISATSPGELAYYGGYHAGAANGLRAGEGRTSDDVHNAGNATRDDRENPQSQGEAVSLEPVNPDEGPIQSRHVLVYAGQPEDRNGPDDYTDRDTIEQNFAGDPNTTVHTVGGAGQADGWDHPGTYEGLRQALEEISELMNPNEQFILFVTDHGDYDIVDEQPRCQEGFCSTVPLVMNDGVYADMLADPNNIPGVTLFWADPELPPQPLFVQTDSFPTGMMVNFDHMVDIDGDGMVSQPGEGWMGFAPLPEQEIDPRGTTVYVSLPDVGLSADGQTSADAGRGGMVLPLGFISLESGEIAKATSTPTAIQLAQATSNLSITLFVAVAIVGLLVTLTCVAYRRRPD